MVKFTADSSIEPEILEFLEEKGYACNISDASPKDIVDYAIQHDSIIITRSTAYSGILGAYKAESPRFVWVGPPQGSKMIPEQLEQILENNATSLQKGNVMMMMPGRNQNLPVG